MEKIDDDVIVCPHCGYDNNSPKENPLHIDPGEIIQERYIVGKAIGYGGFGVTYIGWDALLEHKVAIKEYMPSEFSTRALGTKAVTVFGGKKSDQFSCGLRRFHDEAKMLAKYNSEEGIVSVYDSFEENGTAYIIMELLDGISFADYLKQETQIPYDKAVQLILPIIRSLETIHAQNVLHRDIAPDNLILTKDGKVKLIDFGAARFVTSSQHSMSVLIKPGYTPEEQYSSHSEQGPYTDIYALGSVLYRMITGETPPDSLERGAYYEKNKKDMLTPISALVKDVPENIQNAIYNAICVRAADRTQTMEDFANELTSQEPVALRNKWLKKPGLPLWSKLLIAAAAVTAVVVCAVVVPGMLRQRPGLSNSGDGFDIPEGMARVPSVLDQTLDTAVDRLTTQTLLYSISGKEYSNEIAADLVLSQSIDGGEVVAQNSMIDLVISGGAEMAMVTPMEGLQSQEAAGVLKEAGFLCRFEEEYSDTIAEGYVIRQSAEAGTELAIGTEIVLTISKGRDPDQEFEETAIEAPDFVGKDYQTVLELAQQQQLIIVVKERLYSDEFAENIVMMQNIEAGSEIMTGSTIELTISLGKQIIKVPDLEYRTLEYARTQLDRLGLKNEVRYENSDVVQANLVISYTPGRDSEVSLGDTVFLVVSLGPAETIQPSTTTPETTRVMVEVPNVSGMNESQARAALTGQGFVVGNITSVNHDTIPEGQVISQNPAAKTSLEKGLAVHLTISKGKAEVLPTGITFTGNPPTTLYTGDTAQLSVSVAPDDATDKTVTYRSSDASVIRVDANGKIEALNGGTATITASTSNGKSATLTITVTEAVLSLAAKSVTMPKNTQFELTCESNFAASSVGWRVENSDIICFDRNDSNKSVIIKPLRAGTTKIIAELPGGLRKECTVIVTDPLSVTLHTDSLELAVGDSASLEFDANGSNYFSYKDQNNNTKIIQKDEIFLYIEFSSDDESVVTIDEEGNLEAVGTGYAVITMRCGDSEYTCSVEVI